MAFNQNAEEFGVQLATKMQLVLDQPMSDMSTGLVNHDYEGEFFKIGNTVKIVKPNINSVNVQVGGAMTQYTRDAAGLSNNAVDDPANVTAGSNDARLPVRDLSFFDTTLVIDKTAKYAFVVSDITEVEGRWNYESAGLDFAAQKIRKIHNKNVAELIANDTAIAANQTAEGLDTVLGTAANPITITSVDQLYEDIILPMYAALYDRGAITADGQITAGSNASQAKATHGCIYMPTKLYTQLLKSKYFTDRSTADADGVVRSGKVKTITNLDVAIEPALVTIQSETAGQYKKIVVPTAAAGTMVIIAGTQNTVTRANKVLPPDKLRSHTRFADEYHGLEIYGEKVFSPESACVAFVNLGE